MVSFLIGASIAFLITSSRRKEKQERREAQDWNGQHVLITGGSKGLGLAFAKHILEEGANVTLLSRSMENLEAAKASIEKEEHRKNITLVQCDVTQQEACSRAIDEVYERHSRIDCVVTCAGSADPCMFLDSAGDGRQFRRQIELNYLGTVYILQHVLDRMKKRKKGRVIVVSSASGLVSVPGYSAYSASKFALRGLCDALRVEMMPHNIDVHIFYPSSIDTPGYKQENTSKPSVTRKIEGEVSLWTAEEAANHLCRGVKSDHYQITTDYLVDLISLTTNGIQPRKIPLIEMLLLPLMPLVEWYYRTQVIEKEMMKSKK